MTNVIVFDFDGVIVDSNHIKRDAWFSLCDEREIPRSLMEEALATVREPRSAILRYVLEKKNVPSDLLEEKIAQYSDRYNTLVQESISQQGIADDVFQALSLLRKEYALYINSATPQDALQESVHRLGIAELFQGIYGRPASKIEILERVQREEKVELKNIVFIGDGESDRGAAQTFGCTFVGIANEFNGW